MKVKGRCIVRLRNRVFIWLCGADMKKQAVTFTRVTALGQVTASELLGSIKPSRGASYVAIVGVAPASLGAPHVHVLHTGSIKCVIDHERHSQPVRAGVSSHWRLALYMARHLAQRPAGVTRAFRASEDFPRERAIGLPPVLAGNPRVAGRNVHAALYWHAKTQGLPVTLRVAVRVKGDRVILGDDVPLFWCSKTGLYWPDLPSWHAKDNPRSSQHWRMCQDAARHANTRSGQGKGQITALDVLQLGYKQRFRCHWCDRSLLTLEGPSWHVDHMRPLSSGGQNVPSNLVLACPRCNRAKAQLSPIQYGYRLAARGIASKEVKRMGLPVQAALWRA